MKIQSIFIKQNKVNKLNILIKIIIITLIFIIFIISLLLIYHIKYHSTVERISAYKFIFLDDYILFYDVKYSPNNIKEDILFRSIGDEYNCDWKSSETYDYPNLSNLKLFKIKSHKDFKYIIFKENDKIQLGEFLNLYPISFGKMNKNEREESLIGIYKTIFNLVYDVFSYKDIKSVRFNKNKKIDTEIKIKNKKYTDKNTLKNIYDIICGLELKIITSDEELNILKQPECNMIIKLKNNREIIFYYNSTYKTLYENENEFSEVSNEINNYITSLYIVP